MTGTNDNLLPPSKRVPVHVLPQLFKSTTNSYKFIFALSILELIKRRSGIHQDTIVFSLEDLKIEMFTIAWYPHTLFRLNFGQQDMLAKAIDSLPKLKENVENTAGRQSSIRNHLQNADPNSQVMRYVPYRFIRPFFAEETRGIPDQKINKLLVELSRKERGNARSLYYFTEDLEGIVLNQEWHAYLRDHYAIIESWILWHWLNYMQAHNPNTPNIAAKIVPFSFRSALTRERKEWSRCITTHPEPIFCPYSGSALNDHFELDHILPWSLVAHNQLWNLIPCLPVVNAAKSASIPHAEYLSLITENQYVFLRNTKQLSPNRSWDKIGSEYVMGLRLQGTDDLLVFSKLNEAYKRTYLPLMELAINQGFSGNWRYKPN